MHARSGEKSGLIFDVPSHARHLGPECYKTSKGIWKV